MRVDEQNDERDTELDELRARLRETERELAEARKDAEWHEAAEDNKHRLLMEACDERDAALRERDEAQEDARGEEERADVWEMRAKAAEARHQPVTDCLCPLCNVTRERDAATQRAEAAEALAAKYDAEADKLNAESDKLAAELVDCEEARDAARASVKMGLRELSCVSRELGEMQARAEAAEARWQEAWDIQAREAALSAAQARAESAEAKLKKCMGEAFEVAEELVETRAALRVAREALADLLADECPMRGATFRCDTPSHEAARAALAPKEGT